MVYMKRVWLFFLMSFASFPLAAQDGTGIITIFRDSQSSLAFKYNDPDRATGLMRWPIFVDGKKVLTLHPGRFVSIAISPGAHQLSFGREDSISIEVVAGKRFFVRPAISFTKGRTSGETHLFSIPCSEAIERGKTTEPIKGKDIDWPETISEVRFPSHCE